MLPPDSTTTTGGLNRFGSSSTAATAAAPAGSTTSFARSRPARGPWTTNPRRPSASRRRTAGALERHLARQPDRDPVRHRRHRVQLDRLDRPRATPGTPPHQQPVRRPPRSDAVALHRRRDPGDHPPPPVGTTTVRTCGHCSTISSPAVAWPATMSGWSNGWIRTAPVSASNSRAARRQSSIDVPTKRISAPYARVAFSFGIGAPCGMNTVDLIPSSCAASATPCAWLPALAATHPARPARPSTAGPSARMHRAA